MNPFAIAKLLFRLARFVLTVAWRIVPVVWLFPAAIVTGVPVAFAGTRRALAWPGRLLEATHDGVTCSRCRRRSSLLGRWRCPICKSVETTHAWAPCTACGTQVPAGYILCEHADCAEAIPNPRLRGVA